MENIKKFYDFLIFYFKQPFRRLLEASKPKNTQG